MRRGAKPTKLKVESKRPAAPMSRQTDASAVRDLEERLAEALGQLEARNRELVEAHEQQTATSDILRVISTSPADAQPVFDAIVRSAVRLLFGSLSAAVALLQGKEFELAAITSTNPAGDEAIRRLFPMALDHIPFVGRVVRNRRPDFTSDVEADPRVSSELKSMARERGWRSCLWVPMLHKGTASGVISVTRQHPGSFAEEEIALLQTFADQAVIAIENVRLFTELQTRNRQLMEALDQQTATAEILSVIASSPTEIQPVLDTIVRNAARVCNAADVSLGLVEGDTIRRAAHFGPLPVPVSFEIPLDRRSMPGRAVVDRETIQVDDTRELPEAEYPLTREFAHRFGHRSAVATPLLHKGVAIGDLFVRRTEVRAFTNSEITVLKTFADQAVIAIENVRLFKELQASNRHLTDALTRQTATSEVLHVISRSQTDIRPVFAAILDCAVRLCEADLGAICRVDEGRLVLVESKPSTPETWAVLNESYPRPVDASSLTGRAVVEGRVVHVPDTEDATAPAHLTRVTRGLGFRSQLSVPMLREGRPIGVLSLTRRAAGLFSEPQIELVQTFADQAVIAIENARLLGELQARTQELTRSVGELTALGDVSRALSSTLDVDVVLNTIVTRANDLIGADGCTIFEYDEVTEQFHLRATRNLEPRLVELARGTPLRKGDQGILGQLPMGRQAVQVLDITAGSYSSPISDALIEAGYRAVVAVPLIREDHLIGALTMNRKTPGEFPAETIELLRTFATQSALAIQNARLFREIEIKSRELEVASQHKSEFLANMSHELRTPLNAVIGFSEVLSERMFGDLNEKQDEYLKDIHASGQHLLSLINDILDLSKIEAGRMELEVTDFDLPMAIDNALTLIRERAARRSIALHTTIDERLGQVQADERKVRQVLLNLLSNAIKFTPEGGRIDVHAVPRDGVVKVSVTDTGVGIAPEDQEAVFEEFRQVGTADKKVEGTGLGLALSRKFIELHGGKIWVKSQVGAGSTFTFTVPVRRGE
jgi:signal transduction histidine kinase